jgi:hypothetical protein
MVVRLGQFGQQSFGLLQVGGVEAFGEPDLYRGQQVMGNLPLALTLPEPAQAHGCPQLPELGVPAAGHVEGLLEAGFGVGRVRGNLAQHLQVVAAPRLLPGAA